MRKRWCARYFELFDGDFGDTAVHVIRNNGAVRHAGSVFMSLSLLCLLLNKEFKSMYEHGWYRYDVSNCGWLIMTTAMTLRFLS